MRLSELVQRIDHELVGQDVDITSIVYDSRQAEPGSLFIAVRGFRHDGHDYAAQAVANGAVALLVERFLTDLAVPQVVVADSRTAMGLVDRFYGQPAQTQGNRSNGNKREDHYHLHD